MALLMQPMSDFLSGKELQRFCLKWIFVRCCNRVSWTAKAWNNKCKRGDFDRKILIKFKNEPDINVGSVIFKDYIKDGQILTWKCKKTACKCWTFLFNRAKIIQSAAQNLQKLQKSHENNLIHLRNVESPKKETAKHPKTSQNC